MLLLASHSYTSLGVYFSTVLNVFLFLTALIAIAFRSCGEAGQHFSALFLFRLVSQLCVFNTSAHQCSGQDETPRQGHVMCMHVKHT